MINIILNVIWIVLFILIIICLYLLKKPQKKPDKFHIFVINLSRSKDRLDNFKKYHKEMIRPIPLTRVEAVDKKDIVNTPILKKWHETIALNPQFKSKEEFDNFIKRSVGTNALQLSNVKCLKIGKQKKAEWTILCEDDAELIKEVDFEAIVNKFSDSKVIYLDNRNRGGDGYIPRCCTSCVMYHRTILDFFVKELDPNISTQLEIFNKTTPFINFDFYLYWLITKFKIKCSSLPIVPSGRFDSVNGAV